MAQAYDKKAPQTKITLDDYPAALMYAAKADQGEVPSRLLLRARHPAARQPQPLSQPAAKAPARAPRRGVHQAPDRGQALRRWKRPVGQVGARCLRHPAECAAWRCSKSTVVRNVADTADPSSSSRNGRSISTWTGDQLRCFLDTMADHELYPLHLLAATTGMRRGEIASLRWHNGDLKAARLTISQQTVSVQYQRPQDAHQPPQHPPRPSHCRRVAPLPIRRAHGHRPAQRQRLRVRQARRLAHPPRPDQPDLRARRRQARRPPHPPTRPAPHPRHHPAATERAPQGRQPSAWATPASRSP